MFNLLSYVEPGVIATIWTVVAGIFVTLGVVFAIWWKKITTFIKSVWVKIFGKKKADENAMQNGQGLSEVDDEIGEIDRTPTDKSDKTNK